MARAMSHKMDNRRRLAIQRSLHLSERWRAHALQRERFGWSRDADRFDQSPPFAFRIQHPWLVHGRHRNRDDLQRSREWKSIFALRFRNAAHEVEARGQQLIVAITQVFPGDESNQGMIGDQYQAFI